MKFLCLGADVDVDRKNVGFTRPGTHCELGGGFKYFWNFHPDPWGRFQF